MVDISDFKVSYPKIDDPEYQQKLLNKTEFSILGSENQRVDEDSPYFTFQRNLSILLSPMSKLNRMLIFYEPGVGKTCSAILVHEVIKAFLNDKTRQTIVVTKGKTLEDNFRTEYIKRCPGIEEHYAKDEKGNVRDQLGLKREINHNFIFKKYGAFATEIQGKEKQKGIITGKKTDEWIRLNYSNRLIIFDEMQVLKNGGKSYKAFQRLVDVAENLILIGLSGTPNTDKPSEAIVLINLFKQPKDRLKVGTNGKIFMKKYYDGTSFKDDLKDELIEFYNGYVTYLEQTSDITPTEFIQNPKIPSTFTDFKTYNLILSPEQTIIYLKAVKETHKTLKRTKGDQAVDLLARDAEGNLIHYESAEGGVFMKLAREALMFRYPDGSFGSKGFAQNIIKEKNGKIRFKDPATEQEIVKNISKYSITFAESFKLLKAEPERIFYIYFDNVNNSGLLLYALLLEKVLGFTLTDGKTTEPSSRPKYVRIDGDYSKQVTQILRKVGDEKNITGRLVRVILGSPISGVGLTIPNATRVIIFDSQFTPFDITQIINRINRPGTLRLLEENDLPTDCKAYLLTAQTKDGESVDKEIYQIAQDKMVLIKPQTQLMRMADPLCAVSSDRNDTKECWTAKMRKGKFRRTPDVSTDVLYWRQDEVNEIANDIITKAKEHPVLVTDYLDKHNEMVVYRAVKAITEKNKIIEGGVVFISGDLVFLDTTMSGDANATWYIDRLAFPQGTSLDNLIHESELEKDKGKIERFMSTQDIAIFKSMNKYTQTIIFEQAWNGELCESISKKVKKALPYYIVDKKNYHLLFAEPLVQVGSNTGAIVIENPTKIREFVSGKFQYFRGDVDDLIEKIKAAAKTQIKKQEVQIDSKYGMYGKYEKDQFKIVIIGKGRGRRAELFPIEQQLGFYKTLGVKPPKGFETLDKVEKIAALEKLFTDKELIVE